MNFYLDTEFAEGMRKPISWLPTIGSFNKPRWTIDLISIAIESEDGSCYLAVNKDFNPKWANRWVRHNVLPKLPKKYTHHLNAEESSLMGEPSYMYRQLNPKYKSLKRIAGDVREFCGSSPVFYGYFSDYDWVVFCSLFESMIGLPDGWPMYCRDLKQMLDEVVWNMTKENAIQNFYKFDKTLNDLFNDNLRQIKSLQMYPKISERDEHKAEADAHFNRELHNFINMFQSVKYL